MNQLGWRRWTAHPVMSRKARRLSRDAGIDLEEAWARIRAAANPLQAALYVRHLQHQRRRDDRS